MESRITAGRVPPHNNDAEKAVLGAVMLDTEALEIVLDYLRADDFYRAAHQKIFEIIMQLDGNHDPLDIITVTDMLKREQALDACGGTSYISELTSSVPSSANVGYYAQIVQSASVKRRLIRASSKIMEQSYSDIEDHKEILADAEKLIFDILEGNQVKGGYRTSIDVINETINMIEKLYQAGGDYTGVPSGFPELDKMTSGFQPSDFIVIGARPSVGKTAFALSIVNYMALKKIPVGFFTLEMAGRSVMQRLLSMESRIDLQKIRSGLLKHSHFHSLTEAAARLYEAPLFIDDTPNIKLLDLRAQARRMKKNEQVQAIFIDYIGLVEPEVRGNVPRHEQVAIVSRSLKALARELDIPVICLSQVGRQSEGKEPNLADLRESGSIEQDADVVLFIHRDRGEGDQEQEDTKRLLETDVILAKQRNGPVGHFKLGFNKRYTRFESLTRGDY